MVEVQELNGELINNWKEKMTEENNRELRNELESYNNILHGNDNSFGFSIIKAFCTCKLFNIHTVFVGIYSISDIIVGTANTQIPKALGFLDFPVH